MFMKTFKDRKDLWGMQGNDPVTFNTYKRHQIMARFLQRMFFSKLTPISNNNFLQCLYLL